MANQADRFPCGVACGMNPVAPPKPRTSRKFKWLSARVPVRRPEPGHDGNFGANALRATIVGDWREPFWKRRSRPPNRWAMSPVGRTPHFWCCPERTVTLGYGDAYWPAVIEAAEVTDESSSSD